MAVSTDEPYSSSPQPESVAGTLDIGRAAVGVRSMCARGGALGTGYVSSENSGSAPFMRSAHTTAALPQSRSSTVLSTATKLHSRRAVKAMWSGLKSETQGADGRTEKQCISL